MVDERMVGPNNYFSRVYLLSLNVENHSSPNSHEVLIATSTLKPKSAPLLQRKRYLKRREKIVI